MNTDLQKLNNDLRKSMFKAQINGAEETCYVVKKAPVEPGENNVIQIDVVNPSGAPEINLVIGSLLGLPGNFDKFPGEVASACDSALVQDQQGVGVPFTQGITDMINGRGIYIYDLKVKTVLENSAQLNKNITKKRIRLDSTIVENKANITYTAQMDDFRKDMVEYKGVFYLDRFNGISLPIASLLPAADNVFYVMFKIAYAEDAGLFTVYGGQ